MKTQTTLVMLALAAVLTTGCAHQPSELELQYTEQIGQWVPGMAAEAIPDRKEPQQKLERLVFENSGPDKQTEREALCYAMIGYATSQDTPDIARYWILRKIEMVGRAEVVPGLAELIDSNDPRISELARRGLAGNPSPKAARVLRNELSQADEPERQVALINALAWRGDTASDGMFIDLADSDNDDVALAAIAGLGRLCTGKSIQALNGMLDRVDADEEGILLARRDQVIAANLRAASRLLARGRDNAAADLFMEIYDKTSDERYHIAAITGYAQAAGDDAMPMLIDLFGSDNPRLQLVAFRCAEEIPGKQATQALVDALNSADPGTKVLVLEVLGSRGDRSAINAVHKAAKSDNPAVRVAALKALATVGDSSSVMLLARRAAQTDNDAERTAARESLALLSGADVNRVILDGIRAETGAVRAELIMAVAARRIPGGNETLMAVKADENPAVRGALIVALGKVGSSKDLWQLIEMLTAGISEASRSEAESAIVEIVLRNDDADKRSEPLLVAMADADPATQASLIRILGQVQDRAALPAIRQAAESDNATVAQAAQQALANWQTEYITDWVVSPKYSQDDKGPQELFNIAFAPEKDGDVEWKPLNARLGNLNFVMALHREIGGNNCVAYAKTTLNVPEAQPATMLFGSDDGIKVWLNGKVVLEANEVRGVNPGDNKAEVQLKQGENTLMVKVTQGGADWAFCCGVKAADGAPVAGMTVEAK